MAGTNIPIDVFMYVNPQTRNVDELYCVHPFGISRREDGEWEPISREDSNLDDMEGHTVYELDWSTDYVAVEDATEEDEDREHAAIMAFDTDTLDEDAAKKYGILSVDPSSDDNFLSLEKE
jgi:hypothetical protein